MADIIEFPLNKCRASRRQEIEQACDELWAPHAQMLAKMMERDREFYEMQKTAEPTFDMRLMALALGKPLKV